MPATRKPDHVDDSLLLIIGQLLEATKAASEGIKGLNGEMRTIATTLATTVATLQAVETAYKNLERLVHDDADSLVTRTAVHEDALRTLHAAVEELRKKAQALQTAVDSVDTDRVVAKSNRAWLAWAVGGVAWAVTTGIALYAALGQWAAVGKGP
jgi:prefoldin subunit 5